MQHSPWHNCTLANDPLPETVARLKATSGGDIIAYGGGELVAELIRHRLIDEYHFFVNPVALGGGMAIFREPQHRLQLTLKESRSFACGIVGLTYVPVKD